ncbi:ATP-dependent Clp protease proteolytic subunit [candidate division KSB1 bacterium]|nr:ATP-dependent Clp protease proteolytic subunit [candidate division KSB1 bacterium]RQW01337.1 MAG: ATP-dependent Clp protease proteolytic subunit [candidate division KSB1 bacterium]
MEKELEKLLGDHEINKKFMQDRIIFLWDVVDDEAARDIVKRLLYLDSQGHDDITILINSPGGSVTDGLAVYDAMQNIKSDIRTVCMGMAASMGALLLTAGAKGKRSAWEHSRIMIHQPMIGGTIIAPASGLKIQAEEMMRTKKMLNDILAKHTGQPLEKIEKDTDRDYFMSPQDAMEYGMIDKVASSL